jgi:hypothetical protein
VATEKELAERYAETINKSINQFAKADEVVEKIDRLIYVTTQEAIPQSEKEQLIMLVGLALKRANNRNYLQLVAYMRTQLSYRNRKQFGTKINPR